MRHLGFAKPFRSLRQLPPELLGVVDLPGKGDLFRFDSFGFLGSSVALFGELILRFGSSLFNLRGTLLEFRGVLVGTGGLLCQGCLFQTS